MLSERVDGALQDARALAAADQRALEGLAGLTLPRKLIAHINRDLHSLEDLEVFARYLG
jgi:hypothetical protein